MTWTSKTITTSNSHVVEVTIVGRHRLLWRRLLDRLARR